MRGERVFARTVRPQGLREGRTKDEQGRSGYFPLRAFFFGASPTRSSTMHMREGR